MFNRRTLAWLTVALSLFAWHVAGPVYGLAILFCAAVCFQFSESQCLGATLSTTEIISDVIDSFKIILPMIKSWGTDMSNQAGVYNQQVLARIPRLPTLQTYDRNNGGYKNGAVDANTLVDDVPITLDQWKHVPINITYLNSISTRRDLYQENINNLAYVLAKGILDYCLSKAVAANFTNSLAVPINNVSRDTLGSVRKKLNIQHASRQRWGIVNSDFFEMLDSDMRIASRDYYGQQTGDKAFGMLKAVAGFDTVWEYPDLPDNGQYLSGLFFDRRAIALATRIPNDIEKVAAAADVPQIASFETVQDADTGFTLLGIKWMESGTFDVYVTITALFGAVAGAQGGAQGALTDNAGFRVTTQ